MNDDVELYAQMVKQFQGNVGVAEALIEGRLSSNEERVASLIDQTTFLKAAEIRLRLKEERKIGP